MRITLDGVFPWGRSFEEYVGMFALTEGDLRGRILGCADGPASFQAEARSRGYTVVSCDPLYVLQPEEIQGRVRLTHDWLVRGLHSDAARFVWDRYASPEALGAARLQAMETFLKDYPRGREEGRYRTDALPRLGFADDRFELALCSHFLFLYSESHDVDFHIAAVAEMCRVAAEARIFPLLDLASAPSPYVGPVIEALEETGHSAEIVAVPYEFQRGANQMLRIRRRQAPEPVTANAAAMQALR